MMNELSALSTTQQVVDGLCVQAPTNLSYIPYLKAIGIKGVRIGGAQPVPWQQSWNYVTRKAAMHYKAEGFWVQYDISDAVTQNGYAHPITSSNWQYFHDTVVAEATYLTSQGIVFDLLGLGNELENSIDNTTMTYSSLYTKLQQLALDVKAVYSGKLTYNFFNWPLTSYQGWNPGQGWAAGGIGNFDYIGIHPYGTITPPVVPSNGTISNGKWVANTPGATSSYSLNFNGTNTKVDLGRPTALTTLVDYTFAGWVKADAAGKQNLWSNCFNYAANQGQGIYLSTASNGAMITVQQGGQSVSSGYPNYQVGDWFFLYVEQRGGTVNAWVDGTKVIDAKPLAVVPQGTPNSYLGMETGSVYGFSGEAYNVGIWNRVLTATERGAIKTTYPTSGLVGTYLIPAGAVTAASFDMTKVNAILSSWLAGFGNKAYVSEFNIESTGLNILGGTDVLRLTWMQTMFSAITNFTTSANGLNRMSYFKLAGEVFTAAGSNSLGFSLLGPDGKVSPSLAAFMKV